MHKKFFIDLYSTILKLNLSFEFKTFTSKLYYFITYLYVARKSPSIIKKIMNFELVVRGLKLLKIIPINCIKNIGYLGVK